MVDSSHVKDEDSGSTAIQGRGTDQHCARRFACVNLPIKLELSLLSPFCRLGTYVQKGHTSNE